MSEPAVPLLLIGEVFADYTLPTPTSECKLRLGGIVHAARGLWSVESNFAAAVVCPSYLVEQTKSYLSHLGCTDFVWLAEVNGAPNLMLIGDATELSDQGYQDVLRNAKSIKYNDNSLTHYKQCLIFPGTYDLNELQKRLSADSEVSFDIAYDIKSVADLSAYNGKIISVITSTSSELFLEHANENIEPLIEDLTSISPKYFLLKENRGGSRVFDLLDNKSHQIPAQLGETANSVGVGDVYSAVFVDSLKLGANEAAWKASQAATCYAHTTYPDDFKRDTQRSLSVPLESLQSLGGTVLPWHQRPDYNIYFAAPDFTYVDRVNIDRALDALSYHNFKVRRPIQENGELKGKSSYGEMLQTYRADIELLEQCDLVFALPLNRDPGTLVEMGFAMNQKKPIITYDPLSENKNTMVMAGSTVYSDKLDTCLNATFTAISKLRAASE